ncbi:MAG: VOC family protein [Verrucomicrobia bacterium]|nr:VOC family protein [Verrucomicrobiota bacterium]MDA1065292.1 VOC family protein [Verrucomicrobiota bacterium]
MKQNIGYISLIIPNYQEARDYYTGVLNFDLLEDTDLGEGKRWLLVAPKGSTGTAIVLAEAKTEDEKQMVGNQGAGRVFLFLHTDDFYRDYKAYREMGVEFLEDPRVEPYGTVAVFQDMFGNKWDLLELKQVWITLLRLSLWHPTLPQSDILFQ